MSRRSKFLAIAAVLLLLAGVFALLAYQRIIRPPSTAFLLPEGDLLLYANLRPLHLLHLGKPGDAQVSPDYREFIQETGFQFERDLDEIVVSQRSPGEDNSESSAIFVGRFDRQKLIRYLEQVARATEQYADKTIYSIAHQGRTVRVAILGPSTVAVTNTTAPDALRGIIDKSRNPALAGKGPFLLENYQSRIPLLSMAWIIYRAPAKPGAAQLPGGAGFDFLVNTVTVGSLRYTGSLQVKAEIFAKDEAAAGEIAENATSFLSLYRGISTSVQPKGTDKDVKAALDSIQIQQQGNAAIVTATIPAGFLQKVVDWK